MCEHSSVTVTRNQLSWLPAYIAVVAGVMLGFGVLLKLARVLCSAMSHAAWRIHSIQQQMDSATSFDEWQAYACDLDAIKDEQTRSHIQMGAFFDENLLAAKVKELCSLKAAGRVEQLQFSLRADLYRDFGNLTNKYGLWFPLSTAICPFQQRRLLSWSQQHFIRLR